MFGSLAKRKYQDIGETRPDQETLTIILQTMRVLKGGEVESGEGNSLLLSLGIF